MTYKRKRYLIILGSILSIIIGVFSINEYYYERYKNEIMIYGNNTANVIRKGADFEDYTAHIKTKLEKRGLKNVVVEISGENLYGAENTIFIEVTPPPTKLDKLLHKNMKPISIKHTFINTRFIRDMKNIH